MQKIIFLLSKTFINTESAQLWISCRGGFLQIIRAGIPTYAGMKTGFYADFSPSNRFSRRHRSECRRKSSLKAHLRAPYQAYLYS